MNIIFAIFLARLASFCSLRVPHEVLRHPLPRKGTCGGIAPDWALLPSQAAELTPQLIAEWEEILKESEAETISASERYKLECKISKLQGTLEGNPGKLVKNIALKAMEEAECQLETYRLPVPVERSTMPKWSGEYTDYSEISLQSLETALRYLMARIASGILIVGRLRHNYQARGELIEAGVWDWSAPLFECAPKGTLGNVYKRLKSLYTEAKSLEFAIGAKERVENRDTPDNWTTWNTSGLCGPAELEDDLRGFPSLKGNLDWLDIQEMVESPPNTKAVKSRAEAMRWHDRVNGVDFTPVQATEVTVSF